MKKLTVNVARPYEIQIEGGLLQSAGALIRPLHEAKRILIVTDTNVSPLYEDRLRASLEGVGFQVFAHVFTAGEQEKRPATVLKMVEHMAELGFTRKDLVVALGGGVVGDMAGFAASIYLRGIDFVQIPTTLLSQVDSSVGGKTGVDLPQGKNLCGTFHQPIFVLIDPLVLSTLPHRFYNDGMAEVIKYGCIQSASLFNRLQKQSGAHFIEKIIFESVDIKRRLVEADEKEQGERMLLNFGHTIGHAIEKCHNFEGVSHGEAVGIGMLMMTNISEELGLTTIGEAAKIQQLLLQYQLPIADASSVQSILYAINMDKKRCNDGINLVMLHKIGKAFIHTISNDQMEGLFRIWQ